MSGNGNRFVLYDGIRFEVWQYRMGSSLEIVRKGDGCNVYFQSGDESDVLRNEIENALQNLRIIGVDPVDYICESYEHILRFET